MNSDVILDESETSNDIYISKPSLVLRIKSALIDSVVVIIFLSIAASVLNYFKLERV